MLSVRQVRPRRKATAEPDVDAAGNKIRPKDVPIHLQYLIDRGKIDILKKHFDMFDEDRSGLISTDELADFMRSIGHNPVESRLKELVAQFDTDNNGDLSFGEFVQLWYSYLSEAEAEKLMIKKAFEFFDGDQSNSIDFSEFIEAMTTLGDPLTKEECETFFGLVDKDSNGEIDFDEFVEFVCEEGPVYGKTSKGKNHPEIDAESRKDLIRKGPMNTEETIHARLANPSDASSSVIVESPGGTSHSLADRYADAGLNIEPGPAITTEPSQDQLERSPRQSMMDPPPVTKPITRTNPSHTSAELAGAGMQLPGTIIDTSENKAPNKGFSNSLSCLSGFWGEGGNKETPAEPRESFREKGQDELVGPNKHNLITPDSTPEKLIKSTLVAEFD